MGALGHSHIFIADRDMKDREYKCDFLQRQIPFFNVYERNRLEKRSLNGG